MKKIRGVATGAQSAPACLLTRLTTRAAIAPFLAGIVASGIRLVRQVVNWLL